MIVPVIMAVIVTAAAFIAMLVMMMRLGSTSAAASFVRAQSTSRRAAPVLDQPRHDFSAEAEIIDRTEIMPPQRPCRSNEFAGVPCSSSAFIVSGSSSPFGL